MRSAAIIDALVARGHKPYASSRHRWLEDTLNHDDFEHVARGTWALAPGVAALHSDRAAPQQAPATRAVRTCAHPGCPCRLQLFEVLATHCFEHRPALARTETARRKALETRGMMRAQAAADAAGVRAVSVEQVEAARAAGGRPARTPPSPVNLGPRTPASAYPPNPLRGMDPFTIPVRR